MSKKLRMLAGLLGIVSLLIPQTSFAYEVPAQDSRARYFYIFGPNADKLVGKEDSEQTLFVDVPAAESGQVVIKVYDPDTSGGKDFRLNGLDDYDTVTTFTVFGSSQLDSQTFGADDSTYNQKHFQFGPYDKTQGEKVGDKYRFRLEAKATSGNDGNLFNVHVQPDSAEIFSENITFRLAPREGDHMYFYPEIPAGTKYIVVDNYDLDEQGGSAMLIDKVNRKKYDILDSTSGEWTETKIPVSVSGTGRLQINIEKATQRFGHAGLRVKDDKGNYLPIYFKKGPLPVVAKPAKVMKKAPEPTGPVLSCNQFTFDARDSSDPDNDKIDYMWDFGDGTTSEKGVVTHVYGKGGTYNVKLTVTDNSGLECETATTYQKVEVNTPPTANMDAPELTCVGQSVTLNASGSSDEESSSLTYNWSFDDGTTAEGQTVTKTFTEGGVYRASVTVDDGQNTSCSVDGISRVIRVNTPPVAEAGNDISMCLTDPRDSYDVYFNAEGSHDGDRDNDLTYSWDFGDGNKGEGRRVSHTYAKGGTYTARLTVSDNTGSSCSVDSDTVKVDLSKSPIAVAGDDRYACVGTSINFDGSESIAEEGSTLSYTWDFGDGNTGKGKNATHKYTEGGDYVVSLAVNNGAGGECGESVDNLRVHINSGPRAVLGNVEAACTGDTISFDASGSNDADGDSLKYTWNFGDGTVVDGGSKVSHRFSEGGTYKVSVTVDDGSGSPCGTSTDVTTVKVNTPPVADAGENLVCCQNQKNVFDGSGSTDADGDKLTYSWDLGDGGTASSQTVEHAYAQSGNYNVRLTVDDGTGTSCSTATDGFTANVNAKPVPVIKISQR